MKYIHELLDDISNNFEISGGKGVNLHRLIQLKYNVPSGFIVGSNAFNDFIMENELTLNITQELSNVNVNKHDTIINASRNIQNLILSLEIPIQLKLELDKTLDRYHNQKFAIRSSAAFEDSFEHSWAGQFDSFLDIKLEDIFVYIKKCWASLFNQRALSYQFSAFNKIDALYFAVIIQEMVPSEKAGVAFSVDPTMNDRNRMLIEAIQGHGENMVSGKANTFSATMDKKQCSVISKSFNESLLSITELQLICKIVSKIEEQFNYPVDIEWAFYNNILYLLQVRPITTFGNKLLNTETIDQLPNIDDYELTFKVAGLCFLFTDMLCHGFKYLDPLFTSDTEGNFSQYFTNEKMEYAAQFGLRWFGENKGVDKYKNEFSNYYNNNIILLDDIISNEKLSKSSINRFFKILSKFFTYYSKSDNEFTDLAYLLQHTNKNIIENLNQLSKFKDVARVWINNIAIEENSQFSRFCNKISNYFSIERSDLDCYRVNELIQLFDGNKILQKEIVKRKKSFCIFYSSGQQKYISGDDSIAFINKINSKNYAVLSTEVKGKVANKIDKIVSGRAKIINVDYGRLDVMNNAISEMEHGDILIAEFTAPELMEACRKAKAIITDIGGLLSHAAIVSRELGIPCLVGASIATKTFITGDQVIIDFDSGIVRRSV